MSGAQVGLSCVLVSQANHTALSLLTSSGHQIFSHHVMVVSKYLSIDGNHLKMEHTVTALIRNHGAGIVG